MAIFKDNEEFDSTLLIIGALLMWGLHTAATIFISEFGSSAASETTGRFIDSIVLMVFTYKFTKSMPSGRNGGSDAAPKGTNHE